jgi:hypothetical protein
MRDDREKLGPLPVCARARGLTAHPARPVSQPVRVRPGPRNAPAHHSQCFPFRIVRQNNFGHRVQLRYGSAGQEVR